MKGCRYADDVERISSNVAKDEGGCWLWQLRVDRKGYGRVWASGKQRAAHRVSYEAFVGPIPDGLQIDHLCRVRRCVNPAHLEPVVGKENIRRAPITRAKLNAAKTHCPQRHEYTADNTALSGGARSCRICNRARGREYRERRAMRATGVALNDVA